MRAGESRKVPPDKIYNRRQIILLTTLDPFNHRLRHHRVYWKTIKMGEEVAVGEGEMNAEVEEDMVIEEVAGDEIHVEEGDEKEAEYKLERLAWCEHLLAILNTTFR